MWLNAVTSDGALSLPDRVIERQHSPAANTSIIGHLSWPVRSAVRHTVRRPVVCLVLRLPGQRHPLAPTTTPTWTPRCARQCRRQLHRHAGEFRYLYDISQLLVTLR